MAVDDDDNLYVTDFKLLGLISIGSNETIRKITPEGKVTTIAGTLGIKGSAAGQGASAQFDDPMGMWMGQSNVIYIADTRNSTIRKITPDGVASTFAGVAGKAGKTDGLSSEALFAPLGPLRETRQATRT